MAFNQNFGIGRYASCSENDVGYFLNTTLSYYNSRLLNLALSWSNRQGKLYTPVTGANYNPIVDFYEPVYDNSPNSRRFNHYNSINLGLSRVFSFNRKGLVVFVSVFNLLDSRNQKGMVYSRDYSRAENDYYQARSFYFGCMLMLI